MIINAESRRPRHFHQGIMVYCIQYPNGFWICNLPTQMPATIIPELSIGVWKVKTLKNNQELK